MTNPSSKIDEQLPVEGPAFSYDGAADYLDISKRGVQMLEEAGELVFFKLGPRLRKTTKGQLDAMLQRAFTKHVAEIEGNDPK